MRKFALAYPGDIESPTGGYAYDRRIFREITGLGWEGELLPLGNGFPNPDSSTLAAAEQLIKSRKSDIPIIADCLAWGVMDRCAVEVSSSHRIIPLLHHPLFLETGLSDSEADLLRKKEGIALENCNEIITTSRHTAECLQNVFKLDPSRMTVAEPGVENAEPAVGRSDGKVGLLAVGSIIPRKGYDKLVKVLKTLEHLPWHLIVVGGTDMDPCCFDSVNRQIAELELTRRIEFAGALNSEQLNIMYHQADVFVLASQYEGFGMAFTEAMIRGIPVVATGSGAVSSTVPQQAGMVFKPNQLDSFADSLSQMITNADLREEYGRGARKTAQSMGTWQSTARKIESVLEWESE